MLRRFFFISAVLILAVTASGKLYSTLGAARILDYADRLLLLPNRWILFGVGAIEIGVVCVLLFSRIDRFKLIALLWLSSMFVLYRSARWYFHVAEPCKCLGRWTEKLPFMPQTVEFALELLVAYMFAGSLLFYLWDWWRQKRVGTPQEMINSLPDTSASNE
jgi:hypothetical protein